MRPDWRDLPEERSARLKWHIEQAIEKLRDPNPLNKEPEAVADYLEAVALPMVTDATQLEEALRRLESVAINRVPCTCIWDANEAMDGPDDVIVDPDPDCAIHSITRPLPTSNERSGRHPTEGK